MRRRNAAADRDVRQLPPNVLVDTGTAGEGHVERSWRGRTIRIGGFDATDEVPPVRCAMPSHPQRSLPAAASVLRTIVREADQCLGLYASVARPGRVALGDPVEI